MKKNKPVTKVCSRCEKELPLADFKNEIREAISGKFLWVYPWCNDCSLEVKIKWGTNWIGGTKHAGQNQRERENKRNISSKSRRRTNKKVCIQRIERTVCEHDVGQHNTSVPTRRRSDSLSNTSGPGHIIKTLKKTKDYKESV